MLVAGRHLAWPAGGVLLRHAGEQAADTLLDQLEAPGGAEAQLGGQDLTEAGATVRRLTSLLGALDGEALPPDRRGRLNDVRATDQIRMRWLVHRASGRGSAGSAARCDCGIPDRGRAGIWRPPHGVCGPWRPRRVGLAATRPMMRFLGQTADMVREITDQGGLERVEGLRLMEIVAGPDAALALFGEDDVRPNERAGRRALRWWEFRRKEARGPRPVRLEAQDGALSRR